MNSSNFLSPETLTSHSNLGIVDPLGNPTIQSFKGITITMKMNIAGTATQLDIPLGRLWCDSYQDVSNDYMQILGEALTLQFDESHDFWKNPQFSTCYQAFQLLK